MAERENASVGVLQVEQKVYYLGDPDLNGSWKIAVDATTGNLIFYYKVSGSWVQKSAITV